MSKTKVNFLLAKMKYQIGNKHKIKENTETKIFNIISEINKTIKLSKILLGGIHLKLMKTCTTKLFKEVPY